MHTHVHTFKSLTFALTLQKDSVVYVAGDSIAVDTEPLQMNPRMMREAEESLREQVRVITARISAKVNIMDFHIYNSPPPSHDNRSCISTKAKLTWCHEVLLYISACSFRFSPLLFDWIE